MSNKIEEAIARLREYQSDAENEQRFYAREGVKMQNRIEELEDEVDRLKEELEAYRKQVVFFTESTLDALGVPK
jgi:chromosome segregation ATPase